MKITFDMEGFDRLKTEVETLSSAAELNALNKRIYQRSADVTEPRMKAHMPRSADNTKSGKNGYRPPGHAADNIPKEVTARSGAVGWQLNGDAENWFYMKFVEWGTSKMPARDFLENTAEESKADYNQIAEEEFRRALNERLR